MNKKIKIITCVLFLLIINTIVATEEDINSQISDEENISNPILEDFNTDETESIEETELDEEETLESDSEDTELENDDNESENDDNESESDLEPVNPEELEEVESPNQENVNDQNDKPSFEESYYSVEREEGVFTLDETTEGAVYSLIVEKKGNPSFILDNVNLHIRENTMSDTHTIVPMVLAFNNEDSLIFKAGIDPNIVGHSYEASFSIRHDSRMVNNVSPDILAFSDELWIIKSTRANGKDGYVTYEPGSYSYENGYITGRATANHQKKNVLHMNAKITSLSSGTHQYETLDIPTKIPGSQGLYFKYDNDKFSNEWVKIEYITTYKGNVEVYSDPEYLYIGVRMSIREQQSELKPDTYKIVGDVITGVTIPDIKENLIAHIRLKGTETWTQLDPKGIRADFYGSSYYIEVVGDFGPDFTPVYQEFYDVKFTLKTTSTHQGQVSSNTSVAVGTIKVDGLIYINIYTIEEGDLELESQNYLPGVVPKYPEVYQQFGGNFNIEQNQYYGYAFEPPTSLSEVTPGPPPAMSKENEFYYLVYTKIVRTIQVPELFKFAKTRENNPSLVSYLDLSMYSDEDLSSGKKSLYAVTNMGPKDQSFDVNVSLSSFDNGKTAPNNEFIMNLNPNLVKVYNQGTEAQTISSDFGVDIPIVNEINLQANSESMRLLRSRKTNSRNKIEVWGMQFTEENSSLTRPENAVPGKYNATLHWDMVTGLHITD